MKETNNRRKRRLIMDAAIIAIIVGVIALVIFLLTYKKETHIYESTDDGETSSLVCTSDNNDKEFAFFSSEEVDRVEHKVKLVYKNGKVSKLSYEFTGLYDSEEAAKQAKGEFNTEYNIYIGGHDMKLEVLKPVFQYVDNTANVRLYLDDYKDMNSVIGKLFYISSASMDAVAKNPIAETKKYYEKKGFSCIIGD